MQAPDQGAHPGADHERSSLERLQPGVGEVSAGEGLAELLEEDVGEGRQVEPKCVGVEQVAGAAPANRSSLHFFTRFSASLRVQ